MGVRGTLAATGISREGEKEGPGGEKNGEEGKIEDFSFMFI